MKRMLNEQCPKLDFWGCIWEMFLRRRMGQAEMFMKTHRVKDINE